jgi:hypothetical protein
MPAALRVLFALAVLAPAGIACADQEVSVFATAVHEKLLRLSRFTAPSDEAANELTSEQTVLVDVDSNGSVVRVQDTGPVDDNAAAAKAKRLIRMASPLPRPPATLSADYSTVRLAILYAIAPGNNPAVTHVEVKGGPR